MQEIVDDTVYMYLPEELEKIFDEIIAKRCKLAKEIEKNADEESKVSIHAMKWYKNGHVISVMRPWHVLGAWCAPAFIDWQLNGT